ncbi:hypothetical protein CC85DRAFT_259921 [Cutaneotrichosporon oleaginosum]|uniref:VHS domain-containing protein n=1 Tax=Cutaneotrichosporon oleaginosum TaxID=879819 RepID=A0A0J0XNP1_9TREE|nr:uncharacterized protein CC85DRAFT_259921 [Cutaneotrichosporon oleaginosum]KLT42746.1 hypothetical protein CC85DRAFT_259921 [Cutaneotrichosporon oleaginosum]TXT09535.1 hypothetical protein COLE_03469 [Cutaneotrichosporon oleaginosum]
MADGLGGSRLKKLFRNSKPTGIDPLPIPDSLPPPPSAPLQQPQPSRIHHDPTRRRHLVNNNSNVTPFPVDVGRHHSHQLPLDDAAASAAANMTPTSVTPLHGSAAAPPVPPPPRPSRDTRAPPQTHTPTLAEIQAMQQANPYDDNDHPAPIYASRSRRGTDSSSIDGWLAGAQSQRALQLANAPGPEPPYASPYGSQQPTPPSSQQHFYSLPPGARPPSPTAYGASTPPARVSHMSQNSLHSIPTLPPPPPPPGPGPGYGADLDAYAPSRTRGYSSASQSGRGSDHEGGGGALGTAVGGLGGGPGHLGGMLNKPREPTQTRTSPLVQSYSSDMSKPQPMLPEPPKPKKEKQSFWKRVGDRKSKDAKEAKNKDSTFAALDRVPSPFLTQFPQASMENVARPSGDEFTEGSIHGQPPQSVHGNAQPPSIHGAPCAPSALGHASSTGHGFEDSRLRSRGLDLNLHLRRDDGPEDDDVSSAVRRLCSTRGTTFPDVLELCDRINGSEHNDAVGREAARSIRKVFKNGTDSERRMASRVWLIAMGNISAKDFHRHATSRKLLDTIERILKQKADPPVSQSTYKTTMEIVSGVTYTYHANRSCEHLLELWNKVKRPGDPEFGTPLPDDYLPITPEHRRPRDDRQERTEFPLPVITSMAPGQRSPLPSPAPSVLSRPASEPLSRGKHSARGPGGSPPQLGGVPYSVLPDHDDDMRRLFDECNRALATANKLHEACVFTRPDNFEANVLLHEMQRKALKKLESLNSQMGWAQSEAEKSRRVADSIPRAEQGTLATPEESALEILLKAHSHLSDTLREYDDLSERCIEERQMREVQERSKTDTRMDRRQQMDMLAAPNEGLATTSRSPSPSRAGKALPDTGRSPRTTDSGHGHSSHGSHVDAMAAHVAALTLEPKRSRSPSPGRSLPMPPKIGAGQSPPRSGSPLGRGARVPGPRPLPNPGAQQFRSVNSNPNLVLAANEHGSRASFARDGSGSSGEIPTSNGNAAVAGGEEGIPRPSRKALGKRRAVPDEDNDFDPNEMFLGGAPKKTSDAASDHSVTADEVYLAKPIEYAYDAWAEAMQREKEEAAAAAAAKNAPASTPVRSPATPTLSAPVVSAR